MRGSTLDQSLSIILPTQNNETNLSRRVKELLDVLPDLTGQFEILIVDNGSTDQTEEVANDLTRVFPQVKFKRHDAPQSHGRIVQTGLESTMGEIVFIQEIDTPVNSAELFQLWNMRHDRELILARTRPQSHAIDEGLVSRLMSWGEALKRNAEKHQNSGNTQMMRRDAVEQLASGNAPETELSVDRVGNTDKVIFNAQSTEQGIPHKNRKMMDHVIDFTWSE